MNSNTITDAPARAPRLVGGTAVAPALLSRFKCLILTGIDEGLSVETLYELTRHFPFVEFGVLLSDKQAGNGRYPPVAWIIELVKPLRAEPGPRVALHVCGSAVGDLLEGTSRIGPLLKYFSRVQLNFTANRYPVSRLRMLLKGIPNTTFITQYAPGKEDLWKELSDLPNHAVLFDASGGNGIIPVTWPAPLDKTEAGLPYKAHNPICGYAGGLAQTTWTGACARSRGSPKKHRSGWTWKPSCGSMTSSI